MPFSYKNIFYIDRKNALGLDQEGTVDGVHFNDLGFMRYADFLIEKFEEFELIDVKKQSEKTSLFIFIKVLQF